MPPRPPPEDEVRAEDRAARARLDALDRELRALVPRRRALLDEYARLSDDQRRQLDAREPERARLEALHEAHRAVGRELGRLRSELEAARAVREQRLVALRELRNAAPKTAHLRVDHLRRELAQLELEQQTQARTLSEENRLIKQMRQLREEVAAAEAEAGLVAAHAARLAAAESAFEGARAEGERLRAALEERRGARDRAMASLQSELVVAGERMAKLREVAQARSGVRDQLEALDAQLRGMEREFDEIRRRQFARRRDARRAVVDHNRTVRRAVSDASAIDEAADRQLEALLREGRIRIGG